MACAEWFCAQCPYAHVCDASCGYCEDAEAPARECDEGAGWVVASPKGEALDSYKVYGRRKCCWSRSAPIVYTRQKMQCANKQLPDVYHGSQWAVLSRAFCAWLLDGPEAAWKSYVDLETRLEVHPADTRAAAGKSPQAIHCHRREFSLAHPTTNATREPRGD